jgi:hypothetical protein
VRAGSAAIRERAGAELVTLERFDATESLPRAGFRRRSAWRNAAYAAELVGKTVRARARSSRPVFDWMTAFLRFLDGDGASAERLRCSRSVCSPGWGFGPVLDTCAVCGGGNFAGRTGCGDRVPLGSRSRGARVHAVRARRSPGADSGARSIAAAVTNRAGRRAAQALPPDVNRDCRERLLEIITHHVSGPLKSVEFIAKVARAGGQH